MPTNHHICNTPEAVENLVKGVQSVKFLFQTLSQSANNIILLMESVEGCLECVKSFREKEETEGKDL